ncbi:MAG: cytochrome b/b6 domain-containing protein [Pseudomonadota bacterium]
MTKPLPKLLVFDVPTRFFHWFFAIGFSVAFYLADQVDSESTFFYYHMLMGLALSLSVVLRILWGVWGTKYAKFDSFKLNPKSLISYFKDMPKNKGDFEAGHNPASSWATVGFLGLTLALASTGILMSLGYKEQLEDIHGIFANTFFVLALLHISGVMIHSFQTKTRLFSSMVSGYKEIGTHGASSLPAESSNEPRKQVGLLGDLSRLENEDLTSTFPKLGLLFLVSMLLCLGFLFKKFDSQRKVLTLFGYELVFANGDDKESEE